jgi:hypothetical protein
MSRRSNPARQALWRGRVQRQLLSGLSVAQFCTREHCAVSAFYGWKQRLGLTDAPGPCPSLPVKPPAFLPVTVRVIESDTGQFAPVEADLPNGIRLRIPTANVQLACRLVRAVARAKTNSGGSR